MKDLESCIQSRIKQKQFGEKKKKQLSAHEINLEAKLQQAKGSRGDSCRGAHRSCRYPGDTDNNAWAA